jgi:hypothetical protein
MDGHASGSQLGVIKIVEAIPGYWGGGVRGRDSVAARRSLTPNALGAAPVRAREEESTGQCSQGCTDQHLEERFP